MKNTQIIPFQGNEIPYVIQNETIWIAIKPIVEAIGLHNQGAYDGIKNDEILGQLYAEQRTTGADGKQYMMLCLPLNYVHGWLFGIDHKKASPAAREKLLLYKKECYKALYNHFFGKYQVIEGNVKELYALKNRKKDLERVLRNVNKRIKELQTSNFEALNLGQLSIEEGGQS